jgi:hypothetical protein
VQPSDKYLERAQFHLDKTVKHYDQQWWQKLLTKVSAVTGAGTGVLIGGSTIAGVMIHRELEKLHGTNPSYLEQLRQNVGGIVAWFQEHDGVQQHDIAHYMGYLKTSIGNVKEAACKAFNQGNTQAEAFTTLDPKKALDSVGHYIQNNKKEAGLIIAGTVLSAAVLAYVGHELTKHIFQKQNDETVGRHARKMMMFIGKAEVAMAAEEAQEDFEKNGKQELTRQWVDAVREVKEAESAERTR